jgi:hypothetical protein
MGWPLFIRLDAKSRWVQGWQLDGGCVSRMNPLGDSIHLIADG